MGLLGTLLRKQPIAVEAVTEPEAAAPVLRGPPLIMLIPSVAGISSYRLLIFPDTESAAEFASSSLNEFQRGNIQVFWAMPEQPNASWATEEERRGEALVLIREEPGSDVVYGVSFVHIEAAQAFVRFEVEHGLNPALAMIYWASLARLAETAEGVRLTPSSPPSSRTTAGTQAQPAPEPEATLQAQPAPDGGHIDALWPGASLFMPKPQDIRELEREAAAALALLELKDAERTGLLVEEEPRAPATTPEVAGPDSQTSALLQATDDLIAETADFMNTSVTVSEPVAQPAPLAAGQAEEVLASGPVEDVAPESAPVVESLAPAEPPSAVEPPILALDVQPEPKIDFAVQTRHLLRAKRWEKRDEPFTGFRSPPGRF